MRIIEVEDVEIEFEKQHPEVSCKWCTYVRVRSKKDHNKLLFMIKTDSRPYTRFTMNSGNTVSLMDSLNQLSELDVSIQDKKSNPMPKRFHE
tara:strand:- start:76 stop:351 length:276 start_codon:yes stop_codon:yes gene_type:complete